MKNIMVIDDSPTVHLSVAYALKQLGLTIKQAENGDDALKKISNIRDVGEDLALCICDINMPVMDGISFIKEFRKTDKFTPILILTTESESTKIKEGKEAGATGWIVKPFQPEELKKIVAKFVQ